MSVYRPKGSRFFQYDFQWKGNRFHGSTRCTTERDAKRFEADLQRKVALGETAKPTITVDEACGLWWRDRGAHMKSAATIDYQLAALVAGLGKSKLVGELGLRDFDRYVAKRRHGRKNASVNRETQLARRVWKHADSRGFDVAPIDWGRLMLPEPKERVRELSADEERRLFAALPEHLCPVVEFALLSGQRRTEVIRLRWQDVDLIGGRATVDAKGRDGNRHSFPLTARMVALIANQQKVGPFVFTYECKRTTKRHKTKRIKGQRYPFSRQGWMREWRKALADAGIEDFRFHDLRHTTGTRALRASGNLKAVSRLLGHSDVATTSRYAHALEDDVRAMMEAAESRNSPEVVSAAPLENGGKLRLVEGS